MTVTFNIELIKHFPEMKDKLTDLKYLNDLFPIQRGTKENITFSTFCSQASKKARIIYSFKTPAKAQEAESELLHQRYERPEILDISTERNLLIVTYNLK